jgi:hypothetical protein
MKYTEVTNLRWSSEEKKAIDCSVLSEDFGLIPFTASPDDPEQHGIEIYNKCIAGDFGPIADFIPPVHEVKLTPKVLGFTDTGETIYETN